MSVHPFGRLADGTDVSEIRLQAGATRASVLTLGARLRDLLVPAAGGALRRVVLGFDTLDAYLADTNYIGVTAGRYASRIARGRLRLDGVEYQLAINDRDRHHLHGGRDGFSSRTWTILAADENAVTLALVSPDGDQGYPGTLDVRCTYRLEPPGTLRVTMTAATDAPTVVSLAHHSYFALTPGAAAHEHRLQVRAGHYTPLDAESVPTGEIRSVAGTWMDFRQLRRVAAPGARYDMIFVLDREHGGLVPIANLVAPDERVQMEVHSTEPCLIFYDGGHLVPGADGHDGVRYGPGAGLCLEPIRFPDSPNHCWFPQAVLRPGELYRQVTAYCFRDMG